MPSSSPNLYSRIVFHVIVYTTNCFVLANGTNTENKPNRSDFLIIY